VTRYAVRYLGYRKLVEAANKDEARRKFAERAADRGQTIGPLTVFEADDLKPAQLEGLEVIS
jgi:hypothetical protein